MFRLNPNSRRLKNGKRGFSLVELIVVILIIAILAVAVFAGGSAAIKKAQKARAISDLHNFQIAVAMTMNENPQIANIEAATKRDKLSAIMDALNANLPADYKVTRQTDAMTGNISMDAQTDFNADFIICKSEKTDAWDNPYFVIIDSAQRGGSAASEFYMTTLTAGPNAILNLTGAVDKDDLFDLTSYSDGDVKSEVYDIANATPTIVGGTAAATSYTDPAVAPVNNGITTTATPVLFGLIQTAINAGASSITLTEAVDENISLGYGKSISISTSHPYSGTCTVLGSVLSISNNGGALTLGNASVTPSGISGFIPGSSIACQSGETQYTSVQAAIDAGKTTVVMLKDTTNNEIVVPNDTSIQIDYNDHAFSANVAIADGSNEFAVSFNGNNKLTIGDAE